MLGMVDRLLFGHGEQAEAFGAHAAERVGIGDHHLARAGGLREQRDEEADDARAEHQHRPPLKTGAEGRDVAPDQLGIGVEDAVGGDRTHLPDVDAEPRVEAGGQRDDEVVVGIGAVAGLMPPHAADDLAFAIASAVVDDPSGLHVADEGHGVVHPSFARDKALAPIVPSAVEIGVGPLHEGEFGARGEARIERLDPHLPRFGRAFVVAGEKGFARAFEAEAADVSVLVHAAAAIVVDAADASSIARPSRAERSSASATRNVASASA